MAELIMSSNAITTMVGYDDVMPEKEKVTCGTFAVPLASRGSSVAEDGGSFSQPSLPTPSPTRSSPQPSQFQTQCKSNRIGPSRTSRNLLVDIKSGPKTRVDV
jgi:hypothetical protein